MGTRQLLGTKHPCHCPGRRATSEAIVVATGKTVFLAPACAGQGHGWTHTAPIPQPKLSVGLELDGWGTEPRSAGLGEATAEGLLTTVDHR